jgi:hypothetical protein
VEHPIQLMMIAQKSHAEMPLPAYWQNLVMIVDN